MSRMRTLFITALASFVAFRPASAMDIGKALERPITARYESRKNVYDLERCLILLDGPGVPIVYRQPDRPNQLMIVYTGGGTSVVNVLTIEQQESLTKLEIRESRGIIGAASKRTPPIESCL